MPKLLLRTSVAACALLLCACDGGSGAGAQLKAPTLAPLDELTDTLQAADLDRLLEVASNASTHSNLAIALCDREGRLLRLWNLDPGAALSDFANEQALALARTAALCSSSQGAFSSRALQSAAQAHFPAFLATPYQTPFDPNSTVSTLSLGGLFNTPAGPCWQSNASLRGAPLESAATAPATFFDPGQELPVLANPDGTTPSPGLVPLPGGLPLYKRTADALLTPGVFDIEKRLVGGIGVYASDELSGDPLPDLMEYVASAGTRAQNPADPSHDYAFEPASSAGDFYVEGVLLPYVEALAPKFGAGAALAPANILFDAGVGGSSEPDGVLLTPRDSLSAQMFTGAEVDALLSAAQAAAAETLSALRLPAGSSARVSIAVCDLDAVLLGLLRMPDASVASVESAASLARAALYYSNADSVDVAGPRLGLHPLASIVPSGTALSTRALWFLSQPFYPPGLDSSISDESLAACDANFEGGPLYCTVLENQKPFRFDQQGFAPIFGTPGFGVQDGVRSGLCFVPGAVPLYRNGVLIGALGVAGDVPQVCDQVLATALAAASLAVGFDFEAPLELRCDQFQYRGLFLPYLKLPQNPGG